VIGRKASAARHDALDPRARTALNPQARRSDRDDRFRRKKSKARDERELSGDFDLVRDQGEFAG